MAEEATVRGLKNPKKCSTRKTRNLLARDVRLMQQRVVPGKKGKGSYKRKGRFKDRPVYFVPVMLNITHPST